MEAEGSANSASRSDWTGLVRPRMVLSSPISARRRINGCGSPAMSPNRRDHEGLPNSASILASWARRWSKEGWVEKMVDRLTPLLAMAGVK